jgi:hypothetical protein
MADDITINIVEPPPFTVSVGVSAPFNNIDVNTTESISKWGSIIGTLSAQTDLWARISADPLNTDLLRNFLSTNNIFISSVNIFETLNVGNNISTSGSIIAEQNINTNGQLLSGNVDLFDLFLTTDKDNQNLFYFPELFELGITNGNIITLAPLVSATLDIVIDYFAQNEITIQDLLVTNNATITNDLSVGNNLTITEDLSVGGSTTIVSDLSVAGTFYNNTTAVVFDSFSTLIGDGTNNTINVFHNLNTEDVSVIVKDALTGVLSYPSIRVINNEQINLTFNFVPPPSSYNVSVFGGVPSNRIVAYGIDVIERPLSNVLYVSLSGSDNNSGFEPTRALRTIKKACEVAHNVRVQNFNNPDKKFTIFVGTGDYYEENPIYVAPNTSIIGDNLRRVSIRPINRQLDILWLDNTSYIWGVTFRDHLDPSAAVAFPVLSNPLLTSIAFQNLLIPYVSPGVYKWRKPFITTSPYTQGSSSITRSINASLQNPISATQVFSTSGVPTDREDISICIDTITGILTFGVSGFEVQNFDVLPGALSAAELLELNKEFIKKETIAFINTVYPTLLYDKEIYQRDIESILSAVQIDIQNGNNNESIIIGQAYYDGINLDIPNNQVPATLAAINYVGRLAKFVATNTPPRSLGSGSGMRVDGQDAEGFLRSMVLDSYTQFNEGGKGIHILNNGYAQLVSIFTICCTEGVKCETGGTCSINNSNCSFGLSGLVADGKSLTPILTGTLINDPIGTDLILVNNVNGIDIYPNSDYYSPFAPFDTRKIAYAPYNGLLFTIGDDPALYTIQGNPFLSGGTSTYNVQNLDNFRTNYTPGSIIRFYLRSTITASSHTFEYIGSGIVLAEAVPALGGVSTPETESVFINGGIVYFTSTNQAGDFRVGQEFRIVQETGTIEGDTFKRSILTLVTPLTLALE